MKTAVIICPGRGTYNKPELGYLSRHFPDAGLLAEFDAFRYAQLRVGVRHNLASNDDNDGIEEKTQFTAGLGLNIVGVRLDIGALYSDADVGAALELGTAF